MLCSAMAPVTMGHKVDKTPCYVVVGIFRMKLKTKMQPYFMSLGIVMLEFFFIC